MSKHRSPSPDPYQKWNFNSNPFSIIGITSEAEVTHEKVKKKYHLKIFSCHPDKQDQGGDGMGRGSLNNYSATEVTTAYNFLKGKDEPTLRRLFREYQPSAGTSSSSAVGTDSEGWTWWASSSWQKPNYSSNYNYNMQSDDVFQFFYSSKPGTSGQSSGGKSNSGNGGVGSSGSGQKRTFSDSSSSSSESESEDDFRSPSPTSKSNAGTSTPMKKKTRGPKFGCHRCAEEFTKESLLIDHKKLHRTGFNCSACKQPFETKAGAKSHISRICGLTDSNVHVIHKGVPVREEKKTKQKKEKKERPFLCGTCGKGFDTFIRKVDHEKLHLSGLQCSQCRGEFRSVRGANMHIKRTCGKAHPDAHVLKDGVRFVNDEKVKDEAGNKKNSPKSKSEATATQTKEERKNEPFMCSWCKKKFATFRAAEEHIEEYFFCNLWEAVVQVCKV